MSNDKKSWMFCERNVVLWNWLGELHQKEQNVFKLFFFLILLFLMACRRYDTQHNNIQHTDFEQNDTQHTGFQNVMTWSIVILNIRIVLSKMKLSIMSLYVMTFSIMTFGIAKLRITTLSIMTFSIMLSMVLRITKECDSQHHIMLSVVYTQCHSCWDLQLGSLCCVTLYCMLSIFIFNAIMLSIILLNAVQPSDVAPYDEVLLWLSLSSQ